jgi:rRNA maturation RNase YbeY
MKREAARIVLTRPAVEAGERLGFLPGDLHEKVHPYLRPLYDALYDMLEAEKVASLMEKGAIEVAPLAYMRGRTLNDSFIILDEAQNSTTEQMKAVVARVRARRDPEDPARRARDRLRVLQRRGRRPAPPRLVDHSRVRRLRGAARQRSAAARIAVMPAAIVDRQRRVAIPTSRLARAARRALDALGRPEGEVDVTIVNDADIRALNAAHRGIHRRTDVLAFPLELPGTATGLLGQIVISADTAERQARRLNVPLALELELLTTHGILHLAGYDDRDPVEADLMHRRERELLGAAAPARLWRGLLHT